MQLFLNHKSAPKIIDGDDVITKGDVLAWATYSKCERYRYVLGRLWDNSGPLLVACLLNPSTATENVLDPTLKRVEGFAKRDNYGGFIVVNCFAYRSTNRKALLTVNDPIGPRNDEAIINSIKASLIEKVIAGWGCPDNKKIAERVNYVFTLPHVELIRNFYWYTFGQLTKKGYPRHPLYLSADTKIIKGFMR